MKFKEINPVKFAIVIGLIVVSSFVAYSPFKKKNRQAGNKETVTNNSTLINPIIRNSSLRDSIVNFATKLSGTPYVAGGCNKNGFDCSGFVFYVFQHYRIPLPRSSSQFENFGKEIPIDKVKKGDILVFLSPTRNEIGHVGIVTNAKGKESDFIHATSGIEMKVIVTSLKNEGYMRRFVKAVDVISTY